MRFDIKHFRSFLFSNFRGMNNRDKPAAACTILLLAEFLKILSSFLSVS